MTKKENLLKTINHDNPEWVPYGMESTEWIRPPVVERPGAFGKDDFNVQWDLKEGAEGGTFPAHNGHTITDITKWQDQISFPKLEFMDWSGVTEFSNNIDRKEYLLSGFVEMGLFERSYLLLGMDEALMAYLAKQNEMEQLISAIADYKIKLIELYDDAGDFDIIWYGDDWGTQSDLFLPHDV